MLKGEQSPHGVGDYGAAFLSLGVEWLETTRLHTDEGPVAATRQHGGIVVEVRCSEVLRGIVVLPAIKKVRRQAL